MRNAKRTCWSFPETTLTLNLTFECGIWNETVNVNMRTSGY